MLQITTPAEDAKLLTTEQMRAAAGVASGDSSQDGVLALLNDRITAEICVACAIAVGVGGVPTLRRETVTETLRGVAHGIIVLARRHQISINSITVDGTALATDDFTVDAESGLLYRLQGDRLLPWRAQKLVITYAAGFATVPGDLVGAASDLVRLRRSEVARDPLVRSERVDVEGVEAVQTDYWVSSAGPSSSSSPAPPEISARLSRFMNVVIG